MSLETVRIVREMMRKTRGRVRGMIRRASLGTLATTGNLQTLQAKTTADDVDDDVEYFEPYGFTSGPPSGSEGLVFRVGGERGHSIALCFGNRSTRPTDIAQGEVSLFHQDGAHCNLRNDGNIQLTPKSGSEVLLGDDAATEGAVLGDTFTTSLDTWANALKTWQTAIQAAAASATVPDASGAAFAAYATTVSTQTATLLTATNTFITEIQTFLSEIVRVK